ncbi:MAG: class I SAM-dependent methyltransferase [Candidatus Thorarchaeota archaeon]
MNKLGRDSINKDGYNKIASRYHEERDIFNNKKELDYFIELLPKEGKILDVGCGTGYGARYMVEKGYSVIGVDISVSMLEIAKKNVPEAEFIEADMTKLTFPDNSFDGIVSLYAIFHVSREKHEKLFQDLHRMLKTGGILFFCTNYNESEETDDYLGAEIFWSSYSSEKTLQMLEQIGFEIIYDALLERGEEEHYWIFAKKIDTTRKDKDS